MFAFTYFQFFILYLSKSHNESFLSIENETFNIIMSKQLVKHVFPFQAEFSKKRKKILHRVREKVKGQF